MIGYINTIRDTEYKVCTPELFEQMVASPMVKTHIEEYRRGNAACKSLLPAFLFQGFDPNALLGKKGKRKSDAMLPTGLFMMDFDHVEDPAALYGKFVSDCSYLFLENKVALCHITPSGKGLRLVIKTPDLLTIEEAQADMEQRLQTKMDAVVKDLARLSFCPQKEDILFVNKELLFKIPEINGTTNTAAGQLPQGSENSIDNEGTGRDGTPSQKGISETEAPAGEEKGAGEEEAQKAQFPTHFKGIPYRRIVDELITVYGGTPQVGGREVMVFRVASDLAKITERSVPWLETLIPTFGLPEEEWRATIRQVCKEPIKTSISRNLQQALARCKALDSNADGVINLDEYKDDFPEKAPALIKLLTSRCMPHMKPALSQMLFPALAAHVGSHKFLMGDCTKQELGLMAVLVGKQSTGKSCIDEPIRLITADIKEIDRVNLQRLKRYNEKRKNRKSSERGEEKPKDIIIRCIGGNVTNPALLQLLDAAESGNPNQPNQCLYSEVQEIQRLYKMGNDGGKLGVGDLIKAAFDRADLDSFRATESAVNAVTPARWNFSAATTPEGADTFFSGKLLTDGTLSRIAFVRMPDVDIPTDKFTLGDYDEEFINALRPFIRNLNEYKHPMDDAGNPIPLFIPEANTLRQKINAIIDVEKYLYTDADTYTAYAFRTRDIVIRQALTTWIASGCQWEDCDDYWLYTYCRQMDDKLAMFGDKAAEKFAAEKTSKGGRWTPLRLMKREFTLAEFAAVCAKAPVKMKTTPERNLAKYRSKGFITQKGDKYIISDAVCKMYKIE